MYWISSSHNSASSWTAVGQHIVIIQNNPIVRQIVEVWCRDLWGAMEANIVESLIINHKIKKYRRPGRHRTIDAVAM